MSFNNDETSIPYENDLPLSEPDNTMSNSDNELATQWLGGVERESTASAAWGRMLAGNQRFATGKAEHPWQDRETRESLINQQNPDAAVLSCSDSRVPPEIIFDEGLGDLFTVRSAGQVLDEAVIASLEFALTSLHVKLIVVLGHEHCGAIAAAIQAIESPSGINSSDSILVQSAGKSVDQALDAELSSSDDVERVHVARTIEELVDRSSIIRHALASEQVMIVGARYRLTTGTVEVLSF